MTTVAVFDANAVIDIKNVRVGTQWNLLKDLEQRVEQGEISLIWPVIRETSDVDHPDAPGAWSKGMESKQVFDLEPHPEQVKAVMRRVPEVLDLEADTEQADPDVVAMAKQLKEAGHDVVVVTRDKMDRPGNLSVRSACKAFGIPTTTSAEYFQSIGFRDAADDVRKVHGPGSA